MKSSLIAQEINKITAKVDMYPCGHQSKFNQSINQLSLILYPSKQRFFSFYVSFYFAFEFIYFFIIDIIIHSTIIPHVMMFPFFLNTNLLSFIINFLHYNNKRELTILFYNKHKHQHVNKLNKIGLQKKMTADSRRCLNASGKPSRQSRTARE